MSFNDFGFDSIAYDAQRTTLSRFGLRKLAALDPRLLAKAMGSAQLADTPETVQFNTPSGHTIKSPYMESVIDHHSRRLGGPEAYYKDLGRALSERGSRFDREVDNERDMEVGARRSGNMLGGGALGALAGSIGGGLIGGALKSPGAGAVIGGALGAIGGGMYGHNQEVTRRSGAVTRNVDDISELYKEPEHVKALRDNLSAVKNQMEDMEHTRRFERHMDRHYARRDRYGGYGGYDHYDPYNPYRLRY